MRKLVPLLPLITLLAGCVQEITLEERQHAIQYNVLTENSTRAEHSYSANNKPTSFHIWAVNDEGHRYFGPDEIKENKNHVWFDSINVRYWPKDHSLSFYALVDYPLTIDNNEKDDNFVFEKDSLTGNNGIPFIKQYKVHEEVAKQGDLMYAMVKDQEYTAEPVTLQFHHALSQIVFKAQNITHDLDIQISQVTIGGITDEGKFSFPNSNNPTGSWECKDTTTSYMVKVVMPDANSEYVTLTHIPAEPAKNSDDSDDQTANSNNTTNASVNLTGAYTIDGKTAYDQALNLIPQKRQPWNPAKKGTSETDFNGAYFKLTAIITHKDGPTELYNGNIVIPAEIDWEPGKRYTYNFTFAPGTNGGYTDDASDPQPVLKPLKYTVVVDNFNCDTDNNHNQNMGADDQPTPDNPNPSQGVTVTAPTATGHKY